MIAATHITITLLKGNIGKKLSIFFFFLTCSYYLITLKKSKKSDKKFVDHSPRTFESLNARHHSVTHSIDSATSLSDR